MDPDACLAEILRLAEKQEDRGPGPDYADLVGDLDRMAELVGAKSMPSRTFSKVFQ